jgi:hypothetical protein
MRSRPTDAEVEDALAPALASAGLGAIAQLRRRPSSYRTSFPIDDVDVTLAGGEQLALVLKQLSWSSLGDEARRAKPRFLHDPLREPAVYASVLAPAGLGTPRYYGSVCDATADRHWLFVERVAGLELYQVGDRALWEQAARWLAGMHLQLAPDLRRHREAGRLLDYDARHYRTWIERALELARTDAAPQRRQALAWLSARYDDVVEELLALPVTVIHGELYASNVLIDASAPAVRVCPVDWELAAAAPGLVDLAALVSGGWSDADRDAIVAAYRTAAGGDKPRGRWRELDLCRLHLAVQWLGWAPADWTPPEDHRHDWLGEATSLAENLGL